MRFKKTVLSSLDDVEVAKAKGSDFLVFDEKKQVWKNEKRKCVKEFHDRGDFIEVEYTDATKKQIFLKDQIDLSELALDFEKRAEKLFEKKMQEFESSLRLKTSGKIVKDEDCGAFVLNVELFRGDKVLCSNKKIFNFDSLFEKKNET